MEKLWSHLDLTFNLDALTLTFKILCYISETVRCRKVILGRDIALRCQCAMPRCDLELSFDLSFCQNIFTETFVS